MELPGISPETFGGTDTPPTQRQLSARVAEAAEPVVSGKVGWTGIVDAYGRLTEVHPYLTYALAARANPPSASDSCRPPIADEPALGGEGRTGARPAGAPGGRRPAVGHRHWQVKRLRSPPGGAVYDPSTPATSCTAGCASMPHSATPSGRRPRRQASTCARASSGRAGGMWLAAAVMRAALPSIVADPTILFTADGLERCVAWAIIDSELPTRPSP